MQFALLRTLFTANKVKFSPKAGAPLSIARNRVGPYIEPTLRKDIFDVEKPAVLLVSAVGATGKSALAQVLAAAGELPLLDLSRHKAVGDNTISGLLTNSFAPQDLGGVFAGLSDGTYGMIIDGLDEGRAKTTEQGFEAFLDDIATLCAASNRPTFVLLGRTAVVESCWFYLESKGIRTGLLSIEPFDRQQAHSYIDQFSQKAGTTQSLQYVSARDSILDCLSAAFSGSQDDSTVSFLAFIGYPPVLDAVATVLKEEGNYFRLGQEIAGAATGEREVELVTRICTFILEREKKDKVWVNILSPLCSTLSESEQKRVKDIGFCLKEQCFRLLAYCLDRPTNYSVFNDLVLDGKFEEHLEGFFVDHPFLSEKHFRNAVFEAYALATAFMSQDPGLQELATYYVDQKRATYHLVYMCNRLSAGRPFPLDSIRSLIGATLDFRTRTSDVELVIDGFNSSNSNGAISGVKVNVGISALSKTGNIASEKSPRNFYFLTEQSSGSSINLGDTLADAFIYIPHRVLLSSPSEIKMQSSVALICTELVLDSPSLSVSGNSSGSLSMTILDATLLESSLRSVTVTGARLEVSLKHADKLGYPMVTYLTKSPLIDAHPDIRDKHLRLRKILTHFRSHSKGQLAKYADKVEHERVGGNEVGAAVLTRLIADGILYKEGNFYFVDPVPLHECLGVSWTDLRDGRLNPKLVAYLQEIMI